MAGPEEVTGYHMVEGTLRGGRWRHLERRHGFSPVVLHAFEGLLLERACHACQQRGRILVEHLGDSERRLVAGHI